MKTAYFSAFICSLFLSVSCYSQTENAASQTMPIFERITTEMKNYKLDTSKVPNDKITRNIILLRNLRGGFNINEAIQYKLTEAKEKKEMSAEDYQKAADFFNTGKGKYWLDNAVIWIYRKLFTNDELSQLVSFYKTKAGQKMASNFPFLMVQSAFAADEITNMYKKLSSLNK